MKNSIHSSIYIALLSVSPYVQSQHCTVDTWHTAQHRHQQLEEWYNQSATQFNELLIRHNTQVFMSKEFNLQELTTFWHPQKTSFHKTLEDQIQSALNLADMLNQASTLLAEKVDSVNGITLTWKNLSHHCIEANLIDNHKASLLYAKSAQNLKTDIVSLMLKIETMKGRYLYEAKIIQDAHLMSALEFTPSDENNTKLSSPN